MRDDDTWIGTPAAAERLGLDVQDLYRLIDHGRIPAYRFGRIIRLRRADVDDFEPSEQDRRPHDTD